MPLPPPANPPAAQPAKAPERRPAVVRPPRRRWPGLLIAALVGAGVTAAVVAQYYDGRTLGWRLDATVDAAGSKVDQGVDDLRRAASSAAQGTAAAADRVADAMSDTAITAAVKTALAADPSLSAVKIDVSTTQGVVRLEGPAPDAKSRQRAEVLALAPAGVTRVDNRLALPVAAAAAPAVASAARP